MGFHIVTLITILLLEWIMIMDLDIECQFTIDKVCMYYLEKKVRCSRRGAGWLLLGCSVQCWPIETRHLLKRKDVSFIFTTFSKIFGTNDTSFESPNIGRYQHKNWAWHHPEGGHTPLTEEALLLLKLIWSLS